MKTRLLIIVAIIIGVIASGSLSYYVHVKNLCDAPDLSHHPRLHDFWNCLEYLKSSSQSEQKSVFCAEGWINNGTHCVDRSTYTQPYDGRDPVIYPTVEEIEESVRQEIRDLLANTDVKSYSINLDPKTGIIEITASDDSYDSQIKEIISKYQNDVEFNITYGNGTSGILLDDFQPSELGCDESILQHLEKYSNLLDEEFDGVYAIEEIGLPDGVSQEKFEECVDTIYEKRISIELENEN